jgi:DNA-binding transcriptional regulator YiaG
MTTESLDQLLAYAALKRRYATPAERKRVRQAAGITQAELADALDVPKGTLEKWEQEHTPSGERLRGYIAALESLREQSELAA